MYPVTEVCQLLGCTGHMFATCSGCPCCCCLVLPLRWQDGQVASHDWHTQVWANQQPVHLLPLDLKPWHNAFITTVHALTRCIIHTNWTTAPTYLNQSNVSVHRATAMHASCNSPPPPGPIQRQSPRLPRKTVYSQFASQRWRNNSIGTFGK